MHKADVALDQKDLVLKCRDVSVSLGGRRILRGVDLDLRRGELAVIFGRSGSGKTTFLRCVTGYLKQDVGQIEVFAGGQDQIVPLERADSGKFAGIFSEIWRQKAQGVRQRSIFYGAPSNVCMMFAEDGNLLPQLTAAENLLVGLAPLFGSGPDRDTYVSEALSVVGLADCAGQYPRELSSGQRRRLSFAQTIIRAPQLIALDEPTSALDSRTKYEVLALYQEIRRLVDLSALVVTHDIDAALMLADVIQLFDNGRIVGQERIEFSGERRPDTLEAPEFVAIRRKLIRFLMEGEGAC